MSRRAVWLGLIAAVFLARVGWNELEARWYRSLLPAAIEVDGVVSIDGSSGPREGCGAAVFALHPAFVERLRVEGVRALSEAHQARGETKPYFSFGAWHETPYAPAMPAEQPADSWLSGLDCGTDDDLHTRIDSALAQPGAYYARAAESGLIVIPSLGWVVLSYFG